MCGIFGIVVKEGADYSNSTLTKTLKHLAELSESRGKESAGFSFMDFGSREIRVLRAPVPVSDVMKHSYYQSFLEKALPRNNNSRGASPFVVIGHSRLVTNGTQLEDFNNQPVIKDGMVGIHNGIIVNVDDIWQRFPALSRDYEIDTEVMLALFRSNLDKSNSIKAALTHTFREIFGTVATALLFNDLNKVVLATNNGSLYILTNNRDILIFASEKYILSQLIEEVYLKNQIGEYEIKQVHSNSGYLVDYYSFDIELFILPSNGMVFNRENIAISDTFSITHSSIYEEKKQNQRNSLVDLKEIASDPNAAHEKKFLVYNYDAISKLKRCTKCLLPHTFPFIDFDDKGVCNICRNYVKKNQPKPLSNLLDMIGKYRSKSGDPDCIIPLSGGRDSTYVLHFAKKELGLNPIAFTYDWGMVTDLARRNIARVCGKLGVENIIVSADIRWKRENIRKNISAWLKNPDLGMIPLFMAGDKYFFYYCNQVKKQTGIDLNIWGINTLENTDFKVGFGGLPPKFNKKRIYTLDFLSQVKLFAFVAKNLVKSPSYINQSVFDTLGSFAVRYFYPKKDYYHLFDYIQWDEKLIEDTIINEYNWETAADTKSTWRIGDGTASFYNYIYCTVAGFTENDTFRSNQIREGMITRAEGMKFLEEENKPRYDTLKWYIEIIGLDFESTIKRINSIPPLY